jgi:multidrug efflux system outer membrane protein
VAQGAIERAATLPQTPTVPEGLPSDLLTQRPDIREAEARLAAAAARIEEARARYFPTIRLTAYGGQESKDLGDLLTSPATAWNLAGGLTQPLFGLKKIDAGFDAAEARGRAAEAMYVKTVQMAFAEIHDALGARSASSTVLQAEQRRITALRAAEKIADARYAAGNGGFFDLLDARRNLLSAQILSVDAAAEHLVATIDIYRALGGGWSPEPPPAEGDAATAAASR